MRQLRVGPDQLGKGGDQTNRVLARLQVAHGKNEGLGEAEARPDGRGGALPRNGAQPAGSGIGHYHDLLRAGLAVVTHNSIAREFAAGQNTSGAANRAADGTAELPRTKLGEIIGMLDKTDVIEAHYAA